MAEVWKKDWVYALIPFALGLLPAIFVHSWWWLVLAVVLTLLFVLFRSAQVTGVTQMEQSKPLFERMSFEMDRSSCCCAWAPKRRQSHAADLGHDRPRAPRRRCLPAVPQARHAARGPGALAPVAGPHVRRAGVFTFAPAHLQLAATTVKLFEALLRRKNLLPAEAGATTV